MNQTFTVSFIVYLFNPFQIMIEQLWWLFSVYFQRIIGPGRRWHPIRIRETFLLLNMRVNPKWRSRHSCCLLPIAFWLQVGTICVMMHTPTGGTFMLPLCARTDMQSRASLTPHVLSIGASVKRRSSRPEDSDTPDINSPRGDSGGGIDKSEAAL